MDDWYPAAAEAGLDYGPAFRGLTAAWRDGDTVHAEVALPDAGQAAGFALHPALFDAALHAAGVAGLVTGGVRLPFAWSGVRVHAAGAAAVRVRLTSTGPDSLALDLADTTGAVVATVDNLVLRPAELDAVAGGSLFTVDWVPARRTAAAPADAELVELPTGFGDPVAATRAATHSALAAVQHALATDRRVAVVTTGGVAADAVAGLVRAAQLENPDRIVLVDTDGSLDPRAALAHDDEPHLRIADGQVFVPRLARAAASSAGRPLNPDGTVVITGGTGVLGTLVARHLATRHGIRHLVLVSRSGAAPDLADLDAEIKVVAADVTDRDALAAVLDAIPAEHPLTGVVHAAGVVDDGITESLTPERLDAVLAPKVAGAAALHELTEPPTSPCLCCSPRRRPRSARPGRPTTPLPTGSSTASPATAARPASPPSRSAGACGRSAAASPRTSTTRPRPHHPGRRRLVH